MTTMPSVLANEDHPMSNVSGGADNNAAEPQESFLDLNEQRIRVVSRPSQSRHCVR